MDLQQQVQQSARGADSPEKQLSAKQNPLRELLVADTVKLLDLVQIENIHEYAREMDDTCTKRILKHEGLIKQIMDCALRPDKLGAAEMKVEWPFRAVEFLANQHEDFYQSFFVSRVENSAGERPGERDALAVQASQLLSHLFKILDEAAPLNQTCAGYLLRVFTQIYYQNQQQFFYYFARDPSLLSSCLRHFYNSSIQELLWRVIDTYNEDIHSKTQLMNAIFRNVLTRKEYLAQCLQSLESMLGDLLQRSEEINTRKMSTLLYREIISPENMQLIRSLLQNECDRTVLRHLTNVLSSFIRFFVSQKMPKKSVFSMQDSFEMVSAGEEILKQMVGLTKLMLSHWFKDYPNSNPGQSKYIPMVLLHSILKLEPSTCSQLVCAGFEDLVVVMFECEPGNNILHNQIKGVVKIGLESQVVLQRVSHKLLHFIMDTFCSEQQQVLYLNQLYQIAASLKQKISGKIADSHLLQRWNSYLGTYFKSRKQLYQHPWPEVQGSSTKKTLFEMEEQVLSQQETGDVIVVKKYSEEVDLDLFQFEGKLEYSPTIQLNSLM